MHIAWILKIPWRLFHFSTYDDLQIETSVYQKDAPCAAGYDDICFHVPR